MNLTELHRYTDMLVICISTNTQVKITMTIACIKLRITWNM